METAEGWSSPRRTRQGLDLLIISFLALFLELLVIRWVSSEIRIFAYFKNLLLISAFLGLGLGCFRAGRDRTALTLFPGLLLLFVLLAYTANHFKLTHVIFADPRQFFLLGTGFRDHLAASAPSLAETIRALGVMLGVYLFSVVLFYPVGAELGALFARTAPLRAYAINISGSLLGVLAFMLCSYWQTPPVVWVAITVLAGGYFFRRSPAMLVVLGGVLLLAAAFWNSAVLWSPYYRITVSPMFAGGQMVYGVYVNYDGFQTMLDLSPQAVEKVPEADRAKYRNHYDLPYELANRPVESVLILGGGTGNDAAAALRHGARRIVVVEIDPELISLGKQAHPEKPYQSDRVEIIVDDARAFLQRSREKFDLIVFGTLDSHAVFSSLSSLRLDNYVYTLESVRGAVAHLHGHGGIALTFFCTKPWLAARHWNTLRAGFGRDPVALRVYPEDSQVTFLAGALYPNPLPAGQYFLPYSLPADSGQATIEPTSDDWPFLFLDRRGIPFHYVLPLFLILALSLALVWGTARSGLRPKRFEDNPKRVSAGKAQLRRTMDWPMFFLGAGFMLVEIKSITTVSLLFGSTWIVVSFVIVAVLLMILLGTLLQLRKRWERLGPWYAMLIASLLGNYLFPFDSLNALSAVPRAALGALIPSLPIFFAAVIFASLFGRTRQPSAALASNLIGALFGGAAEYLSMATGLRFLNLIAIALYLAAYLHGRVLARTTRPSEVPIEVTAAH